MIDTSMLKKIAEELFEAAWEVFPTTYGEPLLYKNLEALLGLIEEYHCSLGLYTNGTLLTEQLMERIIPLLNDLKVSFDGATKEAYETLRSGACYDSVLESIRSFNSLRYTYRYLRPPTLTFQFTMMRSNIQELPKMIDLCTKLRVDRLAASHVYIFHQSFKEESLVLHQELSDRMIDEASTLAKTQGLKTFFPQKFSKSRVNADALFKSATCSYLYKETWISSNGDIHPCFMPDSPVMGNLNQQTFEEIWNGEPYKQMRRTVNKKEPFFKRCQNCPIRIQFDASFDREYEISAFTFF